MRINSSEIVENNCIKVIQISLYGAIELTFVTESYSDQSRGVFLQNQIHSWSKCVLKKF